MAADLYNVVATQCTNGDKANISLQTNLTGKFLISRYNLLIRAFIKIQQVQFIHGNNDVRCA